MGSKSDRPKVKRSPIQTVAHLTDEFIDEMDIAALPPQIPGRLESAMRQRIEDLLFRVREAKAAQYVKPLEVRLVRDAHRAVLSACELKIRDAEVYYAEFRQIVEDLGYERVDVGFDKPGDGF